MSDGYLTSDGEGKNLASMADWYDAQNLDISGVGDIVVATTYPGLLLKQFGNYGTATATIVCTTARGSSLTIKVPVGGISGKLPIITNITQSGTDDSLVLYFQKKGGV